MNATERVRIGRTDVHVARLGLGLAPIGGLFSPVGERQARAAHAEALPALARLRDEGLTGAVSAGVHHPGPLADLVRTGGTQVKDATAEALGGTPDDVFADTAIRTYRLELM